MTHPLPPTDWRRAIKHPTPAAAAAAAAEASKRADPRSASIRRAVANLESRDWLLGGARWLP